MPKLSLVVSTLGRTAPIQTLLESLAAQDFTDFEVIFADQNRDDRLVEIVASANWRFPIRHHRMPGVVGVSRGRNAGIALASGEFLLFPDDDCWYPPWFLSRAERLIRERDCTVLAGRAADEAGRSINGRYEINATRIDRQNIWTTQIEWVVFFHRRVFAAIGGYDEDVGPGAGTPWGASEGQDLMLRVLQAGFTAYFEPSLYGHHPVLPVRTAEPETVRKGRSYARGMGHVLRRHGFGRANAAYWVSRPALGALLNLLRGRFGFSTYQWNVAIGRFEGWTGRMWN
ncbi:MAG TPA: glycosyltransferase family A protein [Patescibacteria group bacterium]|nr:glycosyltransferase family A protein [Patescibacteria group bacterium]